MIVELAADADAVWLVSSIVLSITASTDRQTPAISRCLFSGKGGGQQVSVSLLLVHTGKLICLRRARSACRTCRFPSLKCQQPQQTDGAPKSSWG